MISQIILLFFIAFGCVGWSFDGGWESGPVPSNKVSVNTDNFDGQLSILDTDVQKALDTLDDATPDLSPYAKKTEAVMLDQAVYGPQTIINGNVSVSDPLLNQHIATKNYIDLALQQDEYVTQSSSVSGFDVDSGTYVSTHTQDDGASWNLTEQAGASNAYIECEFSGIDLQRKFTRLYIHGWYEDGASEIKIQLWDYINSVWEDYDTMVATTSIVFHNVLISDSENHIDGSGNSKVRFFRASSGVSNRHVHLDYVALVKQGFGGTTTDHGSLSGLGDNDHNQYALLSATNQPFTGTVTAPSLSATSNATDSGLKVGALEFQGFSVNNNWFGDNIYFDGGTFRLRNNGYAGQFYFQDGEGQFRFYPSGSAGDSPGDTGSFVQMKTSNTGEWGIGGASGSAISTATGDFSGSQVYKTASGNLLIGTTSDDGYSKLQVNGDVTGGYFYSNGNTLLTYYDTIGYSESSNYAYSAGYADSSNDTYYWQGHNYPSDPYDGIGRFLYNDSYGTLSWEVVAGDTTFTDWRNGTAYTPTGPAEFNDGASKYARYWDAPNSQIFDVFDGTNHFTLGKTGYTSYISGASDVIATRDGTNAHYIDAGTSTNPFYYKNTKSSTNTVIPFGVMARNSTGTPAAGLGGSLDFFLANAIGTMKKASQLITLWTNAGNGTESADLAIYTTSAGTTAERMRVLANGNVGIGTTTPSSPLFVTGSQAYSYGTGGDSIYNYDAGGGVYYRVHKFTTSGNSTFVAPSGLAATTLKIQVVAGGGASYSALITPGGGAGGVISNNSYSFTAGQSYLVTVGAGGFLGGTDGQRDGLNSVFGNQTAVGGGASSRNATNEAGHNGGSGGGAYNGGLGGTAQAGQGYAGGRGFSIVDYELGGGGGCGAVGANGTSGHGGAGGVGCNNDITGSTIMYACGGGAGARTGSGVAVGAGGCASAGTGAGASGNGGNGAANTGSGGGGCGNASCTGGVGGSGVVIVAYQIPSLTFGFAQIANFNGKVSIGKTTASTGTLDVQGATTTTGAVFTTTDSTGAEKFRIQDGGNVGIGTTAPSGLLDVQGSFVHKCTSGIGKASCHATGGVDGYCSSVVAIDGTCTCNACN